MSTPSSADFEAAHREGRTRWPEVDLAAADFASACAQARVTVEALRLRPDDLYVAYGAGLQVPGAAATLDRHFVESLAPRLRRVGTPPDAVADVLQVIRERLLIGSPPRLLSYNGAAPLRSWIKVIAVRLAIDLVRTGAAMSRAEATFARQPSEAATDAATLLAKAEYKARLEVALRDEIARLPPDMRGAFRLHFVEQETADAIARRFGVHRVTIARWLWSASEQVLEGLRGRFGNEFSVIGSDFDSLVRLVRSTMTVDLRNLFDRT